MLAHRSRFTNHLDLKHRAHCAIQKNNRTAGDGFAAYLQAQMKPSHSNCNIQHPHVVRSYLYTLYPMEGAAMSAKMIEEDCPIKHEPMSPISGHSWEDNLAIPQYLPMRQVHYDDRHVDAYLASGSVSSASYDHLPSDIEHHPLLSIPRGLAAIPMADVSLEAECQDIKPSLQDIDTSMPIWQYAVPSKLSPVDSLGYTHSYGRAGTHNSSVSPVDYNMGTAPCELGRDWIHAGPRFEDMIASSPESEIATADPPTPCHSFGHSPRIHLVDTPSDEHNTCESGNKTIIQPTGFQPIDTRWHSSGPAKHRAVQLPTRNVPMQHDSHPGIDHVGVLPKQAKRDRQPSNRARGQGIPLGVDKNDFILAMREKGLSYKEIKRLGRFREAESTLRGRVRVLTKVKEDRVRKPMWMDGDIKLLRLGLARHFDHGAYGRSRKTSKIPWKRIAEWLSENGGSYPFAPATCARKWQEIVGRR